MKKLIWISMLLTAGGLFLAACTTLPETPGALESETPAPIILETAVPAMLTPLVETPSPTHTVSGETGGELPQAVEAARLALAETFSLEPEGIEIQSFEAVNWPDACLGVQEQGVMCTQVITPGYRVVLESGDGKRYEYHTDESGGNLRLATAPRLEGVAGEGAAGGVDAARFALEAYFRLLSLGEYAGAAELYGGSYEVLTGYNPGLAPDDHSALLEAGCRMNGFQCLAIREIVAAEQVSQQEFRFMVEFANLDGSLFERGPCCGANPADQPPETQFAFTVVEKAGRFVVQELPVYVP